MDCPLCLTPLQQAIDAFYFACHDCGALVKHHSHYVSADEERSIYEVHNNDVHDFGYQRFTAPITDAILLRYPPSACGLDYGCGTGPVIATQLWALGYAVTLYDPFFYPDTAYLQRRYDYIFSCEVFEHFYQPRQELQRLVQLLKPGGNLYIMTQLYSPGTPFHNWHYRRDPTHVFIYTRATMEKITRLFPLRLTQLTDRLVVFCKCAEAEET